MNALNTPILCLGLAALLGSGPNLFSQAEAPIAKRTIAGQSPHHRVWQNAATNAIIRSQAYAKTNVVVELGSGLNRWENGAWIASKEEIVLALRGAVGDKGPFRAMFAPVASDLPAIDVMTPDARRLRSTVLGLAVYDRATGNSQFMAEVTGVEGELEPPNLIRYAGAFDGLDADLEYVYRRGSFEQFIVIQRKFSLPPGFDPQTTQFEVWTEFFDPPAPVRKKTTRGGLPDETLDFGATRIGPGDAFLFPGTTGSNRKIPVVKTWVHSAERQFLVESVRWAEMAPMLSELPQGLESARFKGTPVRRGSDWATTAPGRKSPRQLAGQIRLAEHSTRSKGFVLDYSLVYSTNTLTLRGDTTYYVSGPVYVDWLTIEGGTVVKYTNGAFIRARSIDCQTGPYRPAVFTSCNDTTVGAVVFTNTLSGYYANPALDVIDTMPFELAHLRIAHAQTGLRLTDCQARLKHSQFVHCGTAFDLPWSCVFYGGNIGMVGVTNVITGAGESAVLEHLTTVNGPTVFSTAPIPISVANSLLLGLTGWGTGTITTNAVYVSEDMPGMQDVGAGTLYLDSDDFRDCATADIDDVLEAELRGKTTEPPWDHPVNTTNSYPPVLGNIARRDTNILDLGYHYEPIDHVFNGLTLTNCAVRVEPGTVLAFYGSGMGSVGLMLGDGAQLTCEGSPTNPVRFVRFNTVQEQYNSTWAGPVNVMLALSPGLTPSLPEARFRFTEFSALSADTFLLYGPGTDSGVPKIFVRDSQFFNGSLGAYDTSLYLSNSLLYRVSAEFTGFAGPSVEFRVHNNLFREGFLSFVNDNGTVVSAFDNCFDRTQFDLWNYVEHGFNAYVTNYTRLEPLTNTDLIISAVSYQKGPLSRYYQPTNSLLINRGSVTNAGLAGLYHYTTTPVQVKEGASTLDIGIHWVPVINGTAQDTDSDGAPDFLEDWNGEGIVNFNETDWNSASDPGLKVLITQPRNRFPAP